MDHDRLFKELLTNFFPEFIEAFLPEVEAYIDPETPIEFLDKEIFTDVTAGSRHEADLIARARFIKGEDRVFLIHVENQAKHEPGFPSRMFNYFARLYEKHGLPVYPVAIFSYDAPERPESNQFTIDFPDIAVLQFQYKTIQLNRLPWSEFAVRPNPAAVALMAKMKIAPEDRVMVRMECMQLLRTLRLDPARSQLIGGFVESYLRLSEQEQRRFDEEFARLTPEDREATMEIWTSWGREGLEKGLERGKAEGKAEGKADGLHEGKAALVLRQIGRRFGSVSPRTAERVGCLSAAQLDDLGEALLDFTTPADLEDWLARAAPQ